MIQTTAFRITNGEGNGGIIVDHLGPVLLIQSSVVPNTQFIQALAQRFPDCSIYHKTTTPHVRELSKPEASPTLILGPEVHGRFPILENGLKFLLSMEAGYSTGLFLDQCNNRNRLLKMPLKGKTVLNTFAYTCAFSVCAAKAGAVTTSLDLSKLYLDWGRENFRANNIDDTAHDFIFGDVFEWLPRLAKKNRLWDMIIVDPPTFSTSRSGKLFMAKRDYAKLLALARGVLAPHGSILACMNTHEISVEEFRKITGVTTLLPGTDPPLKSGWVYP